MDQDSKFGMSVVMPVLVLSGFGTSHGALSMSLWYAQVEMAASWDF